MHHFDEVYQREKHTNKQTHKQTPITLKTVKSEIRFVKNIYALSHEYFVEVCVQ